MPIIDKLKKIGKKGLNYLFPGETDKNQPIIGLSPTPQRSMRYSMGLKQVESDLRSAIQDIQEMKRIDPRIAKILNKTAESCVKGGLRLNTSSDNTSVIEAWKRFARLNQLNNRQKLMSDAGSLIEQGNLALQVVIDKQTNEICRLVQMPVITIVANVDATGQFIQPDKAYTQLGMGGTPIADFPLWQLSVTRLYPENYDDYGSMGMPLLHAIRDQWRKLQRTEENLLLGRHAGIAKTMFILENAKEEELRTFERHVEMQEAAGMSTFFSNKKGGMSVSNQGANLGEIADITYCLQGVLSGTGVSKELLGYTDGASLSTIQAMSDVFYEGLDSIQDILSHAYEEIFRFNLLLQGILPDDYDFTVEFVERTTETRTQRVDTALKMQAAGASPETVWFEMGLNPALERERLAAEPKSEITQQTTSNVNIVPGNAPKGESALTVSTRSTT